MSYAITRSKTTLQIRRKKGWVVFRLLLFCCFFWPMLVIPTANIFVYHTNVLISIILIISFNLFLVFIGGGIYLRKKVLVFDKESNQLVLNGKCVSTPIMDLQAVNLGSYIVPVASEQPFRRSGLYLLTSSGTAIEIERMLASGPSRRALKEVGLAIADFLRINTNIS